MLTRKRSFYGAETLHYVASNMDAKVVAPIVTVVAKKLHIIGETEQKLLDLIDGHIERMKKEKAA